MVQGSPGRELDDAVVVTGVGMVTSLGRGRVAWEALLQGRDGIGPVRSFDTSAFGVHVGGEIHDFVEDDAAGGGRASSLALAAARMALQDAALLPDAVPPTAIGTCIGTTSGEPREVERLNDAIRGGTFEPGGSTFGARYPCHVLAATVARALGLAGEVVVLPTACAAGNHAISHASDAVRTGRQDVVLAGGADAFSRITYSGFARLGAIAPSHCSPFDLDRKGMVPGEGAAMLVLERLAHARARGARVYAEIAGYGLSCDAFHMTGAQPEGDGAVEAMQAALSDAGVSAADVDYVSAHGTGTVRNDVVETLAIRRVFGDRAASVPVSSIKSMLGHTMGAASAIEAAVCALAIADGRIPPTIHYETVDPECELDVVPNTARSADLDVVMSNAYAFGGNNSSLILRRVREVGA